MTELDWTTSLRGSGGLPKNAYEPLMRLKMSGLTPNSLSASSSWYQLGSSGCTLPMLWIAM
jgi:hypothetical protein